MVVQPKKKNSNGNNIKRKKRTINTLYTKKKRKHKEYGTSKLEERFARDFLDKLGVKYVYQFEAKDIGRFYDFYCYEDNLLIEVDGSYYHSYGLTYEEMSPMQKKNKRVDELKDKWALLHGIPLLRIWEHDINDNPSKVISMLKERLKVQKEKKVIEEDKKKRHINKLDNKKLKKEKKDK